MSFRWVVQRCPFEFNPNGQGWARGLTDSRHLKIGAIRFMHDYKGNFKAHIKAGVFSLNYVSRHK